MYLKKNISYVIYIISCIALFSLLSFCDISNTKLEMKNIKHNIVSYHESFIVKAGDSLSKLVAQQNLTPGEKASILKFIRSIPSTPLHIGKKIDFFYQIDSMDNKTLKSILFEQNNHTLMEIAPEDSGYKITQLNIPYKKSLCKMVVNIQETFIKSLNMVGVPVSTALNLAENFASRINFERDIKVGDKITIIIEKYSNEDNSVMYYGDIIYSALDSTDKNIELFFYKKSSGSKAQYYFTEGKSTTNSKISMPIANAKLTSKFGIRIHPIYKQRKMHYGIDLAAKTGTPIYAAISGKITYAGWSNGYGKLIKMDHQNYLKTEYAHLSKLASNIKIGANILKGQLIGYVGKTGAATAPHLHFGLSYRNRYVDPLSFKIAGGEILESKELLEFNDYKRDILLVLKKLNKHLEIVLDKTRDFSCNHTLLSQIL